MLMNMKDLLAVARANNFAVPAFNISSNMLLKGVMEASEETQSPVILAIHPDELSFVTPRICRLCCGSGEQGDGAGLHPPGPRRQPRPGDGGDQVRLYLGHDRRLQPAARAEHRHLQRGGGAGALRQRLGRGRAGHHRHHRPRRRGRRRRNHLHQPGRRRDLRRGHRRGHAGRRHRHLARHLS